MMKRIIKQLMWTMPLLLLLAAVGWWIAPRFVGLPAALTQPRQPSLKYLARDGRELRMLLTAAGDRVQPFVELKDIPRPLVYATLAAEDRRFGQHGGVDLLAIARAARDNIAGGRVVSGASTIHQQLIKIHSPPGRRDLWAKFLEAIQARRLGMEWPRDKVMAEYMNRVSYGNLLTGCAAAASGYFDKPLEDLSVAECAFLSALPQAPSRFNPFRDQASVMPRQKWILPRMREFSWITEEELRVATAEPIRLKRYSGGFEAPHAVELLRALEPQPGKTYVRTTLDWFLQRKVEGIITARLATLRERHVSHAAVVVIENETGNVLALAGSRDFFAPEGGQINGAWVPHSPGSAVKPITYALAFARGATAASIVADLPVEFTTPTGTYLPENYAHRLYGPMTYRDALGNSLNISAVKVLASVGGAETLKRKLQDLGVTTLAEDAEHYGLGLTIGNAPMRLVELTNAYACLARLGLYKEWTLRAGDPAREPERKLGERECFLIADILSDNQARLLTFGPHSPLRPPFRAAVKTGTSQSYRDNWTIGYTPEYTVGVWVGNFDNTPMTDVSGITGAAPIWRDVFLELHERRAQTWYAAPAGMVRRKVDPRNGKLLTAQSPPVRQSREEWFVEGALPPTAMATDYDETGRAILSQEYDSWVRGRDNWMGDVVTTETNNGQRAWRISNPTPGTVVRLDPDVPGGGRRLLLETAPPRPVQWRCQTLIVRLEDGRPYVLLEPGRHDLTALDVATGVEQRTHVIVRPE